MKAGAGDTVAGSARDRALALAQEVIDELADDSTVNGAVLVSKVRSSLKKMDYLMKVDSVK